jgi:hypothetical protein
VVDKIQRLHLDKTIGEKHFRRLKGGFGGEVILFGPEGK